MRVKKSELIALLLQLGHVKADRWGDDTLAFKAAKISTMREADADLGSHADLYGQLLQNEADKNEVSIDDDTPADDKPAKAPKKKARKQKAVEGVKYADLDKPAKSKVAKKTEARTKFKEAKKIAKADKVKASDKPAKAPAKAKAKLSFGRGHTVAHREGNPGYGLGVRKAIVAILARASEKKPLSLDEITDRLQKKFPDRRRDGLRITVGASLYRVLPLKGYDLGRTRRGADNSARGAAGSLWWLRSAPTNGDATTATDKPKAPKKAKAGKKKPARKAKAAVGGV